MRTPREYVAMTMRERRQRWKCQAVCAALACYALAGLPAAHGEASASLPQCPYPCGDNTDLFCSGRDTVAAGQHVHSEIAAGLGPEDGWDIRVFQVDAPKDGAAGHGAPSFKVREMGQTCARAHLRTARRHECARVPGPNDCTATACTCPLARVNSPCAPVCGEAFVVKRNVLVALGQRCNRHVCPLVASQSCSKSKCMSAAANR